MSDRRFAVYLARIWRGAPSAGGRWGLRLCARSSHPVFDGSATLVLTGGHVVAMVFSHGEALIRNFVLHSLREECERLRDAAGFTSQVMRL